MLLPIKAIYSAKMFNEKQFKYMFNVIYGVAVIGETCGVFPGFLFM